MGYLGLDGPLGIAHRGGSHEHLENSPSAFHHAIDLGYVVIETDLQVTSDGVLVLMHDSNLARTTGTKAAVSSLSWSELSTIRLRNGEPIWRLEQLFESAPTGLRLNLDPKTDRVVDPLIAFLRSRPELLPRVCLGSFETRRLVKLRQAVPGIASSLGSAELRSLLLALRTGARRWRGPSVVAAQVPEKAYGLRIVSRQFVDFAHELGLDVQVWTVDDPAQMHQLYDLGVDAVMTDRPTVLKQVLIDRGSWSSGQ